MKRQIYISDPEHNRSFSGRWCWIYRGKGWMDITDDQIRISGGPLTLNVLKSDISKISIGTFPRTAKPIPLHYIDVSYSSDVSSNSVYVVPWIPNKSPWLTPVWSMNKNTLAFFELMMKWKNSAEQGASSDR
ncbi:MAG: hypothetical protein H7A51_13865 [Akkermansiaceae bacterium]|nr:hypothetical protein [Akkermansiaceae bacterium]MCP5537303.1 hypothetical protein [Akkermansiaceae bacterium]